MSMNPNPYALFDMNSIKKGDYITHPPKFTLYSDGDTIQHAQQQHRRRAFSSNISARGDNAGSRFNHDERDKPRAYHRSTPSTFHRSEGCTNFKGPRSRYNSNQQHAMADHMTSSTHHDDVFVAASPIKRTNTVGQYYSDSPSMHCLNSANNYYGFAGISRWDNHLIPQQQATEAVHILPLPIFDGTDFCHFPPLHFHQRQRGHGITEEGQQQMEIMTPIHWPQPGIAASKTQLMNEQREYKMHLSKELLDECPDEPTESEDPQPSTTGGVENTDMNMNENDEKNKGA